MKILQLCNKVPFPPKDGGSLATWTLSTGFALHNADIQILAINTSKHKTSGSSISGSYDDKIKISCIDHNTRIRFLKLLRNLLFSKLPYNLVRFHSEKYRIRLAELLAEKNFDIILIEGIAMCLYLSDIRAGSRARIIYRAHNSEHRIWEKLSSTSKSVIKKFYFNILSKRMRLFESAQFNNIDALVCISMNDAEDFRDLGYGGLLYYAPYGVKVAPEGPPEATDNHDLIFIGALDWAPNLDGLEWFINQVWSKLKESNPGLVFHVAGRNPSEHIRKLCSKNGIRFYGEIDRSSELFDKGSILVAPVLSGSGIRIKIIEAMSLGKCVVTTTTGLEGIQARSGKQVLVADTAESYTNAIRLLVRNASLRNEMAGNARRFVRKNFDNFTISGNLVKFINTLIP